MLARLLAQFHNVLIYVLLGAAVMTALLGHWVDTGVILGVVVINALIGFIQEGKAESALAAIRDLLPLQASVVRARRRIVWMPRSWCRARSCCWSRAIGGGRSAPDRDAQPAHRRGGADRRIGAGREGPAARPERYRAGRPARDGVLGHAGHLYYGQGRGVVVATGDATEIGRISGMLGRIVPLTTPLLRQLAGFGRTLTIVTLALAAAGAVAGGGQPVSSTIS